MPLHFTPQYADSLHSYTMSVAVRHDNEYPFANVGLTVDFFGTDTLIERKHIDLPLADAAGNWLGGGFGALYQASTPLCTGLAAGKVTKVVVWQGLNTDTLPHITEVGIIIH